MAEDVINKYLKAGEISYKTKQLASNLVKPGASILDIAERLEAYIRELGGEPAFPINISINHIAAHRTPYADDEEVIPENSLVKIDIGVHVDGYVADTAITFVFNDKYVRLAEAVKKALEKGLKVVKAGAKFSDVGRTIEKVVRKAGYRVIRNLSGHSVDRYVIHAGDVVPNYRDPFSFGKFKEWRAYAIEPFGTDGRGWVKEVHGNVQIFSLKKQGSSKTLSELESRIVDFVANNFRTLPFCERWLKPVSNDLTELRPALISLAAKGVLHAYPVLVEVNKGTVAQFEETVLITDYGPIITTNPELNKEIEAFKKA